MLFLAIEQYALSGSHQGSWSISGGGGKPTGITIDPANVSNIWIVDNNTDQVYQYDAATPRTSGSQSASASFALAAGNTNPQGIADPPPPSSDLKTGSRADVSDNSLAASSIAFGFMQAPIVPVGVFSLKGVALLRSVLEDTESVDATMSQLARWLPGVPNSVSKAPSTPLQTRPRQAEDQSIDLALADEELTDSLDAIAKELLESTLR